MAALFAILGGGNMASAIVHGAHRAGLFSPDQFVIAEPDAAKRDAFSRHHIATVPHASGLAPYLDEATQLVLAVKPQALTQAASDCRSLPLQRRIIISILAGATSARIASAFDSAATQCRVIRAMPNTPAQVGQGCTALALGAGAHTGDDAQALRLFSAIGPLVVRIDESLLDAFTAVAGSGPAYVFFLAEAMAAAARSLGFDAALADQIVRQTIVGSSTLLGASPERTPAQLREAVTSKGGTTEAALSALAQRHVAQAFIDAITAARDRGRQLGS
jgi:pyrroline-5-carboxylate reductase